MPAGEQVSDAAERAWEGWMELHTPIDHTRREAFLAGWAAREAIELEMAEADATEIATLIARRTMVETELAQARNLLVELTSWVSIPRDKEHPIRQLLSRTHAFLEATDG